MHQHTTLVFGKLSGPEHYGTNTIRDLNHHCDLDLEESKANRAHDIQVKTMHHHTSLFGHNGLHADSKDVMRTNRCDRQTEDYSKPPPPSRP